jgi:hypothetical protein
MSITLNSITLHPDLFWEDENKWLPIQQTAQRTITGALVVQAAVLTAGRPITLVSEGEDTAWLSTATLTSLRNLAVLPGQALTLTLRGQARSVIFRHHDGVAIEATPVVHYDDGADWYRVTIRLMEI